MCLAIPAKILSLEGTKANVDFGQGVLREVNVSLVEAKVGMYVLVHAGLCHSGFGGEGSLRNLEPLERRFGFCWRINCQVEIMAQNLKFRNPELAHSIAEKIKTVAPKKGQVKFCHVCGTHEWTITHFGLRSLLPENVEVIAGPGCPVCIVPAAEIDEAVQLAKKGIVITCFGDVLRVPGSQSSLLEAKAAGTDVRIVYAVSDAVEMAKREPQKEFVFSAVGFETTAPITAVEALGDLPKNFSFLVSHRLIPPAMELLLGVGDLQIDGFIAPGHVSAIIGLKPYELFTRVYRMPTVVAGFEPNDVLMGIYMLLKQVSEI